MKLHQYQVELIDKIREQMTLGRRRILVQAPTGAGKTILTAHMLGTAAAKSMSSFFLVHRRELITQSTRAFSKVGVRHGIIANGFPDDERQLVQIAGVQTLVNRLAFYKKPNLIIVDEAHHQAAGSWQKIYSANPQAFYVGVTATPQRLDGKGLDKYFDTMINGPTVRWLIENKYLAPYRLFAPSRVDTSQFHTRMGDFVKAEVEAAIDKPTITGDAITHYLKYAKGKRAVVFCASIKHSEHVVAQFNLAGIPAAHVDGETPSHIRDDLIRRFALGEILILSNVDLFGEGFDLPSMEAVILLRPTQSLGLYLQQVGRVLRYQDGKTAIILDHSGNVFLHGFPDDDREWTLEGRAWGAKRDSPNTVQVKTCDKCYAVQKLGLTACQFCGTPFQLQPREIDEVEGELVEADPNAVRIQRKREQASAKSIEDLIAVGKSRGYKSPERWAEYIVAARAAKKRMGL